MRERKPATRNPRASPKGTYEVIIVCDIEDEINDLTKAPTAVL